MNRDMNPRMIDNKWLSDNLIHNAVRKDWNAAFRFLESITEFQDATGCPSPLLDSLRDALWSELTIEEYLAGKPVELCDLWHSRLNPDRILSDIQDRRATMEGTRITLDPNKA